MDVIHRKIPLNYCLAKQFHVLDKPGFFVQLIFSLEVAGAPLSSPRTRTWADPGTGIVRLRFCQNALEVASAVGILNILLRGFLKMPSMSSLPEVSF